MKPVQSNIRLRLSPFLWIRDRALLGKREGETVSLLLSFAQHIAISTSTKNKITSINLRIQITLFLCLMIYFLYTDPYMDPGDKSLDWDGDIDKYVCAKLFHCPVEQVAGDFYLIG